MTYAELMAMPPCSMTELNSQGLEEINGLIYVHKGNAWAVMPEVGHGGPYLITVPVERDGKISLVAEEWVEVDVSEEEVEEALR